MTRFAAVLALLMVGVGPLARAEPRDLDTQYGQILAQLAQAMLQRVQDINLRTPGEITRQEVQESMRELVVFQGVAQNTQQTGKLQWFPIMLSFAEATQSDTQSAWAVAARARQADPNTMSAIDLEILRLRAELASVNLQRGRQLVKASPDEQQNWALGVLTLEIQRLQNRAGNP
jgi:hypothetical protein